MESIETIKRILTEYKTIAVVGLSAKWNRPSHFAAKYMKGHGYKIIPVNPAYDEILGEKCYPSLLEIPGPVDIVDIFRRSEDVPPIVEDTINIGAKVVTTDSSATATITASGDCRCNNTIASSGVGAVPLTTTVSLSPNI